MFVANGLMCGKVDSSIVMSNSQQLSDIISTHTGSSCRKNLNSKSFIYHLTKLYHLTYIQSSQTVVRGTPEGWTDSIPDPEKDEQLGTAKDFKKAMEMWSNNTLLKVYMLSNFSTFMLSNYAYAI